MSSLRLRASWAMDGMLLTAWCVSIILVLSHEGMIFTGTSRALRFLKPSSDEFQEQWFGIYYKSNKVGFTHLMLVPDEYNGSPGLKLVDTGRIRFSLLGIPQLMDIKAEAFIDSDYNMQKMSAQLKTDTYHLSLSGQRRGDEFVMKLSGPASSITRSFKDTGGGISISGLSSWAAFHQLRVGDRGSAWLLNPLALTPERAYFYVRNKEAFEGREAFVIETDYRGLKSTTWITSDGTVLKETSPMGWDLINEPMEKAVYLEDDSQGLVDLLSTVAVPVDKPLVDLPTIKSLTLLVENASCSDFAVDRAPWQEILPREVAQSYLDISSKDQWCLIKMRQVGVGRAAYKASGFAEHKNKLSGEQREGYLKPSVFVQSDDAEIIRKANEIIETSTSSSWQNSQKILRWVYDSVTKQLSAGFSSARDVLASRVGDCQEHTVLFTALARSVGIPTRMVAGIVSYEGKFYYHVWPEVWVSYDEAGSSEVSGVFVPVDPTLGEGIANITHIGLVEAEGEELVSLARFVGKIKIRVAQLIRVSQDEPKT